MTWRTTQPVLTTNYRTDANHNFALCNLTVTSTVLTNWMRLSIYTICYTHYTMPCPKLRHQQYFVHKIENLKCIFVILGKKHCANTAKLLMQQIPRSLNYLTSQESYYTIFIPALLPVIIVSLPLHCIALQSTASYCLVCSLLVFVSFLAIVYYVDFQPSSYNYNKSWI